MQDEKYFFTDLEKNAAVSSLLDFYIKARESTNFPTNKKCFDEDVNVYICHLLFAFAMPNYNYITEQYISLVPDEVRMLVDMAEDNYFQYFIYKVNGDNLLLRLGLFDDLKHGVIKKGHKIVTDKVDYRELAKYYYQQAARCNRKIHKRKTALSEVLLKLVHHFDHYAKALKHVRRDYYFFYDCFEDEEFSKFSSEVKDYEKGMSLKAKQDLFLDLYSQWLRKKTQTLKKQLSKLCLELRGLDPTFSFKIDD
ncbi:MAG: hypothetical protein JW938_01135 [Candidatus Omnitrophica bacterium]|nr:hypothetical protein [Candidatus Omnitrophota bacterium]